MSIDIKMYATLQRIYIDKFFTFDFIFYFLYYTLKIHKYWLYKKVFKRVSLYVTLQSVLDL